MCLNGLELFHLAFELDPRIANDTQTLGEFSLSLVGLMRDANYPWLVLVPRKPDLIEMIDLDPEDFMQLNAEIAACAKALKILYPECKLNLASLGNLVSQLHVHVIARHKDDPAWPGPVWGKVPPRAYVPSDQAAQVTKIQASLSAQDTPFSFAPK